MTSRAAHLALAVIATALLAAAWLATSRLAAAQSRAAAALRTAAAVERDAARLESLRAARPTVGKGAEPQADALALLNAAMSEANLAPSHLRSLTPEAQSHGGAGPLGAHGYHQRDLRLTLGAIDLPDLGRFLQSWRSTQGVWTMTRISLRHEPSARDQTNDLWTATMTLSAMYLQSESERGTP